MLILETQPLRLVSLAPLLPAWPTLESVHLDEKHLEGEKNEEANSVTAEPKVRKGATAALGG